MSPPEAPGPTNCAAILAAMAAAAAAASEAVFDSSVLAAFTGVSPGASSHLRFEDIVNKGRCKKRGILFACTRCHGDGCDWAQRGNRDTSLASHAITICFTQQQPMSFKRPRTPVDRSPSSSPTPLEPTAKSSRRNPSSSQRSLLCSLPPTCNPPRNQPTHIANTRDLESHYAMYHAHVCESQGCGCVFPEAKLLELVGSIASYGSSDSSDHIS